MRLLLENPVDGFFQFNSPRPAQPRINSSIDMQKSNQPAEKYHKQIQRIFPSNDSRFYCFQHPPAAHTVNPFIDQYRTGELK
jgi:hypothetical protein